MKVKIKDILFLFKKMYCDELKIMDPDTGASFDITQNQKCKFVVAYHRLKKDLVCNAEMIIDSDNHLIHVTFTPSIQNISFDDLILPGIQCPDEITQIHQNISVVLSHPELIQEFTLTFDQLELLYRLFMETSTGD